MDEFLKILKYIVSASGWGIAGFIIYLIVKYPENLILISSKIHKVLIFLGSNHKKRVVSDDIRGRVLKATKIASVDDPNIAPFDLKVQFVKEKEFDAFLREGQVIIRMSHNDNSDRNIVWAVNQYVKMGIIPYAKPYMPEKLITATDLLVTKKLIEISCKYALNLFYSEILNACLEDKQINTLFSDLHKADCRGIFTKMFLNELGKLSLHCEGEIPSKDIREEIKNFAAYVIGLATRSQKDFTELEFWGRNIKVAVILAASEISESIIKANTDKVIRFLISGYNTIYILAIGKKISVANDLLFSIKKHCPCQLSVNESKYKHKFEDGNIDEGCCIEISEALESEEIEYTA